MQNHTGIVSSYALACALLLAAFLGLAPAAPAMAGTTALVNVGMNGEVIPAYAPFISADGRYIAFSSDAAGLVPGDTNDHFDAFVRDMVAGTTERISLSSTGQQLDLSSTAAAISADGRCVAVMSDNTNVVPGVSSGSQMYVYDRLTGAVELASMSSTGEPGNDETPWATLSADGRCVAFASVATNLAPGYIYPPPVDLSGAFQVFFRDRVAGTTDLVSVPYEGTNVDYNPSFPGGVSADGRYVAFWSNSCNFVRGMQPGPYVRDLLTKTTEAVSVSSTEAVANNGTGPCAMTADGRYVVFTSLATNLVPSGANGHWQVYLRDRIAGTTELVSVSSGGEPANGDSERSRAWRSATMGAGLHSSPRATNLVPDDTNGCGDVFVRDRVTGVTCRVSVSSSGEQGDQGGGWTQQSAPMAAISRSSPRRPTSCRGRPALGIYVHDLAGPFSDVWETSWAYQVVAASAAAGIVSGYPDGTYEPTDPVTRDQMAVYISRSLAGG